MNLTKPIQGLLGALSLKVGGYNPNQLADAVVPTIDVYDQFFGSGELKLTVVSQATTLTSAQNVNVPVPAGKNWRVLAIHGQVVMNVADVALIAQGQTGVLQPGGAAALLSAFTTAQLGITARGWAAAFRPALFLPSGWTAFAQLTTSAAITVAGSINCTIFHQEFDA